jgi:hypothetical protein
MEAKWNITDRITVFRSWLETATTKQLIANLTIAAASDNWEQTSCSMRSQLNSFLMRLLKLFNPKHYDAIMKQTFILIDQQGLKQHMNCLTGFCQEYSSQILKIIRSDPEIFINKKLVATISKLLEQQGFHLSHEFHLILQEQLSTIPLLSKIWLWSKNLWH